MAPIHKRPRTMQPEESPSRPTMEESQSEYTTAVASILENVCEQVQQEPTITTLIGTNRDCQLCFEDGTLEMVACDSCKKKTHFKCLRMDSKTSSLLVKFHCKDCREKDENLFNEWKLRPLTAKEQRQKKDLYFTVAKILDHRNTSKGRTFLIQWKNYPTSTATWEPEEHLDGCYDSLQTYCEQYGLEWSKIEGKVGATSDVTTLNENNWVKPSEIVKAFHKFQEGFAANITVEVWDELRTVNTIYIVPFEAHCCCSSVCE